jgi:hypothetical protein
MGMRIYIYSAFPTFSIIFELVINSYKNQWKNFTFPEFISLGNWFEKVHM